MVSSYVDSISGPSGGVLMHLQRRTYSKSFKLQMIQKYSDPLPWRVA